MPIPQKMYVGTDKDYYIQGEKVIIDGRLELYVTGSNMQFWIEDNSGKEIWRSPVCNQPYNHAGYQTVEPPLDIFKSTPPYYAAFGMSDGLTGKHKFAYY